MNEVVDKLAREANYLGRDLSKLPWWYYALGALLAFVLFLVIASAVLL